LFSRRAPDRYVSPIFIVALVVIIGAFSSSLPAQAGAPFVRTDYPGYDNDILVPRGWVNPQGLPTVAWFEYAQRLDLSDIRATVRQDVGSGVALRNLVDTSGVIFPPATTFIRAVASNSAGTGIGDWIKVDAPGVSALEVIAVRRDPLPNYTYFELTVQWVGSANGLQTDYVLETSFDDPSLTSFYKQFARFTQPGDVSGVLSKWLSTSASSNLYYRLTATNVWGTWNSGIKKYTTGPGGPRFEDVHLFSVADHEATLAGTVTAYRWPINVYANCTAYGVQHGVPVLVTPDAPNVPVISTVRGLSSGTTYQCRLEAVPLDLPSFTWSTATLSVTTTRPGPAPIDPGTNWSGYIPHIVSGDGFATKITITSLRPPNYAPVSVKVNFVSQTGTLLSSSEYTLDSASTLRIESTEEERWGPMTTKWAIVGSSSAVGINTFYELLNDQSERKVVNTVGFNDAPAMTSQQLAVEVEPAKGGIFHTVGVAIANPNPQEATAQISLISSSGTTLASSPLTLNPYAQTSFDLQGVEAFKSVLPAQNFQGTLRIDSNAKLVVTSLGDDSGPFFATPAVSGGIKFLPVVIPHIVSGGGFATRITLVNPTAAELSQTINFYNQNGMLASKQAFKLAPHAIIRISTPEPQRFGQTTTTWAAIGPPFTMPPAPTSDTVHANAFLELKDASTNAVINAIGFNDVVPGTAFTVPVEFEPAPPGLSIGRTVGIAIANPNSAASTITLKLLDSAGQTLATASFDVPQMGQTAIELGSLPEFKAALPVSRLVGVVTIGSTEPVGVVALGDDYGPFYATPAIPGKAK